jgi:DNA-binding MarR family transcriptional regulator
VTRSTTTLDRDASNLWRAVQALVRRFSVSERAEVSCCGMTVAQAAAVQALREGSLRMSDLARRLGISPSTATRNLQRLEQTGLVERFTDDEDARVARVRLTKAGERAADELGEQEVGFARSILEQLPPERRQPVSAALEELLTAVRRATESCCPGAFDHLLGNPVNESCCDERNQP